MRKGRNAIQYPLVPSQVFSAPLYQRGEPTGMVFCPMKLASIATMRCGDYQERNGCGAGCPSAAPASDIAELKKEMTETPGGTVGRFSFTCQKCGGEKKSWASPKCRRCGNKSGALIRSARRNGKRARALAYAFERQRT